MSPRTGRPTSNPRPIKISIRINEKSAMILEKYCSQEKITKTEAIERGIKRLAEEIK